MDDRRLHWAWQQRSPRQHAKPIGQVLGPMAGTVWFGRQEELAQVVGLLERMLPAELLGHLAVEGLKRNTLHLKVDSASHRFELELAKEALIESLNAELRGLFIREIRLSLGGGNRPTGRRSADG